MKKRFFSVFCALALCLGILSLPVSKGAQDTPFFMALNDTLLPLEEQFMPIAVSGQYYVPYTVLDSSVTGQALGIFPIYNSILGTLTIYSREQVLTFYLSSGICKDRNDVSYSVWLVTRNGRIYVPVRFVCEYFGLTHSICYTVYGPMIRIRSASSRLDDTTFVDRAQTLMESRLREWRRGQSPEETPAVPSAPASTSAPPSVSASTSAPPSVSAPTPSAEPEDSGTDIEDKNHVRTYLTFRVDQTDGLEEQLALLDRYQLKALFFFPAEDLAEYDAAVRKVLCGGHAAGLLIASDPAQGAVAQAEKGNRLLAQIAHLHADLVLAPNADDSVQEALAAAGLLVVHPTVDARPDGRSASSQAVAVLEAVEQSASRVTVLLDTSADGAALTRRVLAELVADNYNFRIAVETEIF